MTAPCAPPLAPQREQRHDKKNTAERCPTDLANAFGALYRGRTCWKPRLADDRNCAVDQKTLGIAKSARRNDEFRRVHHSQQSCLPQHAAKRLVMAWGSATRHTLPTLATSPHGIGKEVSNDAGRTSEAP